MSKGAWLNRQTYKERNRETMRMACGIVNYADIDIRFSWAQGRGEFRGDKGYLLCGRTVCEQREFKRQWGRLALAMSKGIK